MTDDLLKVRNTVNAHKLNAETTAASRKAFEQLKRDTGMDDDDFSDNVRTALQIMFIAGVQFGSDRALNMATKILMAGEQ